MFKRNDGSIKYNIYDKFEYFIVKKPSLIQDNYSVSTFHDHFHISNGYSIFSANSRCVLGINKKAHRVSSLGVLMDSVFVGKSNS